MVGILFVFPDMKVGAILNIIIKIEDKTIAPSFSLGIKKNSKQKSFSLKHKIFLLRSQILMIFFDYDRRIVMNLPKQTN
jgi:hypothetical protein